MKTMKNTIYTVLIGLALVFSGTSCSGDDDGGDGGTASSGTVQAKVDGSNFASNNQATTATLVSANNTLAIYGTDLNGKTITLNIIGVYDGEGTYQIGGGANVMVNASYSEASGSGVTAWQAPFDSSVAGEINISSQTNSEKVVGTFNFTAKTSDGSSTKVITEGSFNINITNQ